jgi:hypothetical protein
MGVDCSGWVEVNDPRRHGVGPPYFPKLWSAVIRIDDIVDRNYDLYGYFFSVYKHPDNAIASRRGLPAQLSEQVEAETEDPTSLLTAVTWILWSEILVSDWQANIKLSPGWSLLFTLMEQLATDYGNTRVRLVIWFDDDIRV